jgi:hypothetical protein
MRPGVPLYDLFTTIYLPIVEGPGQQEKSANKFPSSLYMAQFNNYEATKYETNLRNHLVAHYVDFLRKLVYKQFAKEDAKVVLQAIASRNRGSLENIHLASDFYDMLRLPPKSPVHNKEAILYDVKVQSIAYLPSMVIICAQLESEWNIFHHCVPLTTSHSTNYYQVDSKILLSIVDRTMVNVKANQKYIWDKCFMMDSKAFRRNGWKFNYLIETDGVGCSIIFTKDIIVEKKKKKKKNKKNAENEDDDEDNGKGNGPRFLDSLSDEKLAELKKKHVVGVDPGIRTIVHMSDGKVSMRYTSDQRREASKNAKYQRLLRGRNGQLAEAMEVERQLDGTNKKTCDIGQFINYIRRKIAVFLAVRGVYGKSNARKFLLNSFVNRRRSVDRFLNKVKKTWKQDKTIFVFGHWTNPGYLKGNTPSMGRGIHDDFARHGLQTYLIGEEYTSKTCYKCRGANKRCIKDPKKPGRWVHGLLRCKSCLTFWDRDQNGAQNIRRLAVQWILHKERDKNFCFWFRRGN